MFESIAEGAFLSRTACCTPCAGPCPSFIAAAGVLVSFRCGYFNIGAQGQFYVGAIAAAFVADWFNGAPAWIMIPAMLLTGIVRAVCGLSGRAGCACDRAPTRSSPR